jgi:metallophosphoesterase superfamily enzyme
MQTRLSDEIILDSRRAVWLPAQRTLVLADLFLGLGASRRKRTDAIPSGQHHDLWERLLGLLSDLDPSRVALLGDIKPSQGSLDGEEAEELSTLLRKIAGGKREVVQVVGHPERSTGPFLESAGIRPVEHFSVGPHTLMHRRRIFVYPRHEPPHGIWINGGLHPLFALPSAGPAGQEEWLRHPAFLYTGFALVMPPFVSYAQGWEVMQPERLPRQARAWKLLGERIAELDLPALPSPPESLRTIVRPPAKFKAKAAQDG